MVLAPEHPLVGKIVTPDRKAEIEAYQAEAARKSDLARQEVTKEKTGAFTGAYAWNPLTDEKIPVWVADYVMMGYGTGAIMAVPAHDERDYDFAIAFNLPIRKVVEGGEAELKIFSGEGITVNSGFLDGMNSKEAKEAMIRWAEKEGRGNRAIQYKLRDWLFSRQRYWGEPFPILHKEDGTIQPVPEDMLPVLLPQVESYEPMGTGESPLAAIKDWVQTKNPKTGEPARRETDTMPGSAGSSWYFLRYCDPRNANAPFGKESEKYWMPVDLYVGGAEHAVGHLLYARFWTKVLYDAEMVTHDEPFRKLVHQGMILGEDGEKMSKSRGNVINPDDVVSKYGADTLRIYEMFMGPLERDKPWSTSAIEGVYRFLQRAWRVFVDDEGRTLIESRADGSGPKQEDVKILHKTIKKVTEDIENLRFNTAISQMMVFINHFTKEERRPRPCLRPFVQLLNPFAPHMAEELWERLGETTPLSYEPWPDYDPKLAKDDVITIAVQVMGKTRGTIEIEPGAGQEVAEKLAKALPSVANQLSGKTIRKVIYVQDKILNFIVG